jgi:transposase InsO family protein
MLSNGIARPRRKRLSWESRCEIVAKVVEQRLSPEEAAASSGVHRSTVYRLGKRYRLGGWAALRDQPSTPKRQPRKLSRTVEDEVVAVRERTQAGPQRIGVIVGMAASTVGKVLRRRGCSRLPRPERDPVVRYERERPGELVHVDSKKLGCFWVVGKRILRDGVRRSRTAGWQYLHVAIDDHSRLAYAELLAKDDGAACAAFWERALAFYRDHGIVVERVLTDNAKAYSARAWRLVCARHRIRRRFTRPYRPQTNGKAEALIKTLLREWAYRFAYPTSHHRAKALPGYLRYYNRRRPHSALDARPPLSRVADLCGQYS